MLHNLFSLKYHLFHIFIFLCPNNTFFINQALTFQYPPRIKYTNKVNFDSFLDIYYSVNCSVFNIIYNETM